MNRPWDGCVRQVVGKTTNKKGTHMLAVLECGHTHLLASEAWPGTGSEGNLKRYASVGVSVICGSCRDGLPPERKPKP